ncbi:uncharacterized protein [Nicotiana sylvestris]|uniref:uncharacterized protein n=1 Tax=Nicotiana sylvestris TaxID=4096 RepID=UPI00388C44F5
MSGATFEEVFDIAREIESLYNKEQVERDAKSQEEHTEHLRVVLEQLREEKLYAKFSKCEFWLRLVAFLGRMVSNEGIQVDPKKIKVVQSWTRSSSAIEIQSFLGLAGYYSRLVQGFSSIASPMTKLTQMGSPFRDVTIGDDGVLRMQGWISVPNMDGLRELILEEAHSLQYSIHLSAREDVLGFETTLFVEENEERYSWTDGQFERTIQILEDMLRASYQSSIQMAPYEALYGRWCRSPVGWFELGEARHFCIDLVQDALDKVKLIQEWLCKAHSRQKSYADRKVRDVSYMVGEKVLPKVSPMKGVMRFGKKGKLSSRFIWPFELLQKIGEVAYELSLPPSLSSVHPLFHVSMLWKYIYDPSHVLDISTVQLDGDLTYDVELVAIWGVRFES